MVFEDWLYLLMLGTTKRRFQDRVADGSLFKCRCCKTSLSS